MTLQAGPGSYAAPKPPKPVTLASSIAPYFNANTGSSTVANNPYAGISSAFPSSVASTSVAPTVGSSSATLGTLGSVGSGNASDYSQQIADLVAPTARAVSAQGVTNQANLSAQRQQALAQFGYIPANLSGQLTGDVNADLDPSTPQGQLTRQLAAAGTAGGVSTYAQLQKAYADQQKSDWANLAARNMVHSGAAGQHMNEDLTAYQQQYSSKVQSLLDALQGYYQTYLTAQATGQQSLADATDKALQQIIAQIQANQYLAAQTAQQQASGGGGGGGGGGDQGGGDLTFNPPEFGQYAGYVPTGTVTAPQTITAPDGGVYRSGGGVVTYQSKKGPYGGKALI